MAFKHINFWIEFAGKIGPPIFAATLVGCLLSFEIKLIHIVLLLTGLVFMGINHWFAFHRNQKGK